MASQWPPVKGQAFSFEIGLYSQADTKLLQDNPTMANGDFIVVKDGTLDGNMDNLPTAVVGCTRLVTFTWSADEMTADRLATLCHDVAGTQWCDFTIFINTAAQTLDVVDGIADAIKAKTDNLPASPAAVGSAMTLTGAYDAAKTAAQPGADGDTLKDLSEQLDVVNGVADSILLDTGTDGVVLNAAGLAADARAEIADAVAAELAGSTITVTNPVSDDGSLLTLVRGDDYDNADGRALGWSSTSWPVLTSATILFTIERNGVNVLQIAGTVVTATGTTKAVRAEPAAAETGLLDVGRRIYTYDVQATLSGGNIVTLVRGEVTVLRDYT